MNSRRHEAGDMGHVHEEEGPGLLGDGGEAGKVDGPGVGAPAGDDHLRPVLEGEALSLVVVEKARLFVHPVAVGAEEFSRDVHRCAVGKMPSVAEVHSEDDVPGLEHGHEDGEVGVHPRMGLDIGVLRSEEGLGPLDGEALHHVDEAASSVVPLAGVPLGILVGENGALGLEDHLGNEVLRGDELNGQVLPGLLPLDGGGKFRIEKRYQVQFSTLLFEKDVFSEISAGKFLSSGGGFLSP